jgi:predicted transcriptional regulator
LLRLGERRIAVLKRALGMSESAFSHALNRLQSKGLVEAQKNGREKLARLSSGGRIVFASLQALCYTLSGNDGTSAVDDHALAAHQAKRSRNGE